MKNNKCSMRDAQWVGTKDRPNRHAPGRMLTRLVFAPFLLFLLLCNLRAAEPLTIPVGLDAYRQWERWPCLRIGERAYMRSTYDRSGGNEGADASHFLYQLSDDRNVTLDIQGPGVLYFVRYNHWHGSPWHYEVDGGDYAVRETSTADPNHPAPNSVFLPETAFPNPLTWTWSSTKGADLSWTPVAFEKSFRMAYARTHYGTGYYIYHQYVPGAKLSRRIRSWNPGVQPGKDVLALINRAGTSLVPAADSKEWRRRRLKEIRGTNNLPSKTATTLAELRQGPTMLRAVEFDVPRDLAIVFGKARLRVFWDGARLPSIDAPLALFFGGGTLYNRDRRDYLVKAFPVNIRFDEKEVHLACYFPMPFFHSARLELENPEESAIKLRWRLCFAPCHENSTQVGYFHATFRDHTDPRPGRDLVLLDTREVEGGGDWAGHLVGMSWIFSERAVLGTLEGDPRFFFDDSQTPQACGTGTEEWGGGGDYWGGQNMTLPFAGHPTGARDAKSARCDEDKIESAYRFLLADLMPFGKNALIQLEHGGRDDSTEHYQTVTCWYGLNRPALVKTDELQIGDQPSEQAHSYSSPQASQPYEITSRYEWGVDTLNGKQIYPVSTDIGRKTSGTTEFNLKLQPDNWGLLLRRKLDYQFPNQRAEVSVAEVGKDGRPGRFKPAGVWFCAGGNTCIYSNPKDELGAAQHNAQTSNRRFRDDEFLVSRRLTRGRPVIRVRIRFTPVRIPLFPGNPLPELAWTELRYTAYCFVTPSATR